MTKAEYALIPSPGAGHLVSALEFARRLVARDPRLSITILVMKSPLAPTSVPTSPPDSPINFILLPDVDPPSDEAALGCIEKFITDYVDSHKSHVKDTLVKFINEGSGSRPLAGLVLDLFCTSMIDVANELGVSSYLFYTSGAAFLGLKLHLPVLYDRGHLEMTESESEIVFPTFRNPFPGRVIPRFLYNKHGYVTFVNHARRFREMKGIIVNTFEELEPYAVNSLRSEGKTPKVYTVGPVLDLVGQAHGKSNPEKREKIMNWMDAQPEASVVYLCFGSVGFMGEVQMKEVALGLMRSGVRFLWSVRKPPAAKGGKPTDYSEGDLKEILPVEFMALVEDGRGVVCGWAPQVEVLAHDAVAGFVSHCGWNSVMESLWFGRPIVTWPMYAEQQSNAFQLVRELGLGVEMRLAYEMGGEDVVRADEVERAIRSLMDEENEVPRRVKEMGEMSRRALMEGGSSFNSLGELIEDMLKDQF